MIIACSAPLLAGTNAVSATVTPGVKPDIVLSPAKRVFTEQVTSLLINDLTPQADPTVVPTADQCRDLPPLDAFCDVYRIKIVRDKRPGAENFVQLHVAWDRQATTPSLALVAAGLSDSDVPDLDLFLYKDADTYIDYGTWGRSALIPERIAWEATQDEYDLVIRAGLGISTGYSIKAWLSAELFDKPFELLDDAVDRVVPDDSALPAGATGVPADDAGAPSSLALLPVDADDQIAGVGLGATERFDPAALALQLNTRAVAATGPPPSTLELIVAMVLLPAAATSLIVIMLRRRRDAYQS